MTIFRLLIVIIFYLNKREIHLTNKLLGRYFATAIGNINIKNKFVTHHLTPLLPGRYNSVVSVDIMKN